MKNLVLIVVSAFVLLPLRGSLSAQDTSAVNVQTSCAHWSKLRVDKHKQFKGDSDDLYQTGLCVGYFSGLMDGMDDTGGWRSSDGSLSVFQIKRSAITSTWDAIRAFYKYTDANPLASGKPAWSVLQTVLTSNGLATFTAQAEQPETSALTNECKTGADNVITQFSSDNELNAIDTSTLVTVNEKLEDCLGTKGLIPKDSVLLLTAHSESSITLLARAVRVLDHHELLPELRAERSASMQDRTASHAPKQMPREQ